MINPFYKGGGCVTQCKVSELTENSNIQREELTCTQPTSLRRLFIKSSSKI